MRRAHGPPSACNHRSRGKPPRHKLRLSRHVIAIGRSPRCSMSLPYPGTGTASLQVVARAFAREQKHMGALGFMVESSADRSPNPPGGVLRTQWKRSGEIA